MLSSVSPPTSAVCAWLRFSANTRASAQPLFDSFPFASTRFGSAGAVRKSTMCCICRSLIEPPFVLSHAGMSVPARPQVIVRCEEVAVRLELERVLVLEVRSVELDANAAFALVAVAGAAVVGEEQRPARD